MNLYKTDFNIISEKDKKIWEELKEKEIVSANRDMVFRKSLYSQYPKAVRHFQSLFPNNFIDTVDLYKSKDMLSKIIDEFEKVINNKKSTEITISKFIRDYEGYFIIGSVLKKNYPFGHHALFLFPEFKLPPNYQTDYLLVGENSDGYHLVFIELENPYNNISLRDGSFGETIRKGIKQCVDWDCWLESYFSNLKLVFEKQLKKEKALPNEFRDFDKTRIHFLIVAGRRDDYKERTYRLRRSEQEQRKFLILHYDNLIDYSRELIGETTY